MTRYSEVNLATVKKYPKHQPHTATGSAGKQNMAAAPVRFSTQFVDITSVFSSSPWNFNIILFKIEAFSVGFLKSCTSA